MAGGVVYELNTWSAKRIIGDSSASAAAQALLQTGEDVATDIWILNRTNRASLYGIKYKYDEGTNGTNGTKDKIELYGGYTANAPTAWIQLDTGDAYFLGQVGIGDEPDGTHQLYVNGTSYFTNTLTINNGLVNGKLIEIIGINNKTFSFKLSGTPAASNVDIGWDWTNIEGAGAAFRSSSFTSQEGEFRIYARKSNNGTAVYTQLIGTPGDTTDGGNLSWGGSASIGASSSGGYKLYVNGTTYGTDNCYFCINSGLATFGDTVQLSSPWTKGDVVIGKNGTDKIVAGYLASSTNGATIGAHVSALNAWAPLYVAGTQIYIRGSETTWAKWTNGCLSLFPTLNDYREGIRIHSYNSWSDITLCGNDNTGDNGISANSWFIGNNNGNFYITRNGSTSGTAYLSCVSNVWNFLNQVTFGARVTSTAPSALTSVDRIVITPYYHTGGPWKITSRDDASNAYLSLYYNTTETARMQHNGTLLLCNNISFTNSGTAFRGINYGTMGDNDQWRIGGAATGSNAGYMELATADDGNEPIYVRQYTGVFSTVKRTLTLLDANGYSYFPSYINIGGHEKNASSPSYVWGSNSSDNFLRSYQTGYLNVGSAAKLTTARSIWGQSFDGTGNVNGLIYCTASGIQAVFGAQNTGWVHFTNNGGKNWYFDHPIHAVTGFTVYNTSTSLTNDNLTFAQGGGWYMSDTTWIRAVGNKAVYTTGVIRSDGAVWGNQVVINSNWVGFYNSVQGKTRYGYVQANADRMYFRKENGANNSIGFDFGDDIYCSNEYISGTANGVRIKNVILRNDGSNFYFLVGTANTPGDNWNTLRPFYWNLSNGYCYHTRAYNAVWNDYAEFRKGDTIEPGYCVVETSSGIMTKSTSRLQSGAKMISDTYGEAMGETKEAKTPIAVSGRMLAYTYRNRNEYPLGAAVCSAPGGTIDVMTREEIMMYPERIVGTVSEIPNYDIWNSGGSVELGPSEEIQVNGRIWIYVR